MHKRIVEAIQQAIEGMVWKDNVDVYVHPQPTGGFWRMAIHENGKGDTYLPHIRGIAQALGCAHGEGLSITHEGRWLLIQ